MQPSSEPDAVGRCLRAFADANVTQFMPLSNRIDRKAGVVRPADLLIYRSDRGANAAYLVLGVELHRRDGTAIGWSISLNVSSEQLEVAGVVEITDDDGSRELFARKETTTSAQHAAELIARFSAEVCAQDRYIDHK